MPIALTTHKRLWANAGKTCAFPDCDQLLLEPLERSEDELVIGKECHIVARSDGGPRAPASLTEAERSRWRALIEQRDGYANLILLCGVHHDVVDGDPSFTVARLVEMKRAHELAADTRPADRRGEAIEIRYAAIVDEWARRIDLDGWDGHVSPLVESAWIEDEWLDALEQLGHHLLSRVWPRTLPRLEDAFLTFRLVAEDLMAIAGCYGDQRGGQLVVDPFYGAATSERVREHLEERSGFYRGLSADLAIELTRAVNLVSDRVRESLWPGYRLEEGYATIGLGLDAGLVYRTLRPLYAADAPDRPYPGLVRFLDERGMRDYARDEGPPPAGVDLPLNYRLAAEDD